jgi:hypothetical protein
MRDFVVPKTNTKIQGPVTLEYAFRLTAKYDPARFSRTPRGEFRYQNLVGGELTGARFKGTVYPDVGGQYDTVRGDHIRDVDAHFIVKADNGEWIYIEHVGYRRRDDYYRAIAYIDADEKGAHEWLNDRTFVVTARESADEREVVFDYYVAA